MNLNDLSAAPLNDAVDFANLPAQGGGSAPPPYPGPKRVKLPKTLTAANFAEFDRDGKKRLEVTFNEAAPLVIVQSDPQHQDEVQTTFQTRLNNNARERGKKGSGHFASDLDYLLQAAQQAGAYTGARPASNREFAVAVLGLAQKEFEFGADVEWSWRCGTNRDARFATGEGSTVTTIEVKPAENGQPAVNRKGCGTGYYQGDVEAMKQANGGLWPLTITCGGTLDGQPCGANLRAFGNLSRIRK